MANLYIEDGVTPPSVKYQASSPGAGWTQTTDPVDWDLYISRGQIGNSACDYKDVRNDMITSFEPSWATYTDAQKKALIRNYVWPPETTAGELDALYTSDERLSYMRETMDRLRCNAIHPVESTQSNKTFDMRVNDSGTLVATEITTDTTI